MEVRSHSTRTGVTPTVISNIINSKSIYIGIQERRLSSLDTHGRKYQKGCRQTLDHHISSMNYPPTTVHQTRFDLNVEPNPFERSFQLCLASSSQSGGNSERQAISPKQLGTSIFSSPLADQTYQWPLLSATSFTNSLNAGPLNPAMLSAPQNKYNHISFDPTSFFAGFSPRSGITPRAEFTTTKETIPLPLIRAPVAFPTPTTALLELMHGHIEESSSTPPDTVTLDTVCALPSSLDSTSNDSLTNSLLLCEFPPEDVVEDNIPSASISNTSVVNGLYLLTQANEELKRREHEFEGDEMQTPTDETKGMKRKSHDVELQPEEPRQHMTREISASLDRNEGGGEEGERLEPYKGGKQNGGGGRRRTRRKQLTEEEKRKDFLERNRIGMFLPISQSIAHNLVHSGSLASCLEMPTTQKGLAG